MGSENRSFILHCSSTLPATVSCGESNHPKPCVADYQLGERLSRQIFDMWYPFRMERTDLDLKALKTALLEERAALIAADDATAGDRAPVTLDQQSVGRLSRMDALQVQAMAKAQGQRRAQRLKLIDAALSRMESGEYGICTECDEEIPARRLAVDPTFMRCVDCAG